MYPLLGIDALLRIALAMAFLFLALPALARRRPAELDRMQWFWWCFAAGVTLLALAGQLFALLNIFSTLTLLLAAAAIVVIVRSRVTGRSAAALLHDLYRATVVFTLNTLDGRVNVARRVRRAWRRARGRARVGWAAAGWMIVIIVAAAFRLVRPFVTPNFGFSDTYAHLYLLRLLEHGQQVDPAWGPYPRGMHFLLLAIHELTNVEEILLMNFFGSVVGVLMTLAVADTARRLAGKVTAGLLAGLIFATMIGGGSQYFLLGGSVATDNAADGRQFVRTPYEAIPETYGEFDVLLTVFQRQTTTLPQELAIVFLFPAAMFLYRRASWWDTTGYLFCCSAIAAVHPGVAVPLVLLSGVTVLVCRLPFFRTLLTGAAGLALGSTWMLAFIAYPRFGPRTEDASGPSATSAYYFPWLREGADASIVTWVALTPFILAAVAIAIVLTRKHLWIALATLVFFFTHVASRFGLPELVETRRNSSWLAMTLAILLGVALAELARFKAARVAVAALLVVWLWRVPLRGANDRLIDYSGYKTTAEAVLQIQRKYEPFTWTLVTYGQEFPMVLGKGFHLPAADFLDRFDPARPRLAIPTKYVFIVVEKTPHHFQIDTWKSKFSRGDLQRRLQTWCFLYQLNHRDIRVWRDEEDVRVYLIERSDSDVQQLAREGT
jgi:hypothetical protein